MARSEPFQCHPKLRALVEPLQQALPQRKGRVPQEELQFLGELLCNRERAIGAEDPLSVASVYEQRRASRAAIRFRAGPRRACRLVCGGTLVETNTAEAIEPQVRRLSDRHGRADRCIDG